MFKRIVAFVLGAVIVFGGFSLVPASALTQQEKTALVLQLVRKVLEINQKIVALGGTPIVIPPGLAALVQGSGANAGGVSACTISRTLALGMRGDDVTCLQTYLISQHLLAPDSATGYFGPLTRTAVIALQTSRGLEPVGHVGKLTRVIVNGANGAPTSAPAPALPVSPTPSPPVTPPSSGGGGGTPPPPVSPTYCTPLPAQTQTLACPTGQIGSITQTRTSSCPADATSPVWGQWQTTANTCVASLSGYDIIIVGGQSNAVGSGLGAFTDPYESAVIDAKIFQLGRYGSSSMQVVPATWVQGGITYDALQHWGSANRQTMGLAIPFARRYAAEQLKPGRSVLIIPAAAGATSILKWLGEITDPPSTPNALYDDMLARAKAGLALPGDNRIVAVLWHQGESDVGYASQQPAWYSMSPVLYRQKLTTLMQKIRTDLPSNPPFPIIAGDFVPVWDPSTGLSQALKLQFEDVIRQVMADDVRGAVATSTGLVTNYPSQTSESVQWIHFTSASLVTLGDRYYQAWKQPSLPLSPYPANKTAFVSSLYSCVLGRTPAQSEIDGWIARMSGGSSLETMFRSFFFSDEFQSKRIADTDFVSKLYRCILFRDPDAGGRAQWATHLSSGTKSRYEVFEDFIDSPEFSKAVSPALKQATGLDARSASDTNPIGPYATRQTGGSSWSVSDKILMTPFFFWYNALTGAHMTGSKGLDELTDHPVSLTNPPLSWASTAWWRKELSDVSAAWIDVILPVYWGFPHTASRGANGDWNYGGIMTLVQTLRDMDAQGLPHPKVGMFYDTSTLQYNALHRKLDLRTDADRAYFYRTIRDYYSMIPPKYRAQIDGKPIIVLFWPDFAAGYDQGAITYVQSHFQSDFGVLPYIVKDKKWNISADNSTEWGAAPLGITVNGITQIGPGYDQTALTNNGERGFGVVDRQNGDFYALNWKKAMNAGKNVIIIETWNELHEGTDIAESKEYGRRYIDLTRAYADQWRAGVVPDITVPCGVLPVGGILTTGQSVNSCNHHYGLVLQGDGNLVEYDTVTHQAVWNTKTFGTTGSKVMLQTQGNLVLSNASGTVLWASNFNGGVSPPVKPSTLKVQDDGVIRITALDGSVQWSSVK